MACPISGRLIITTLNHSFNLARANYMQGIKCNHTIKVNQDQSQVNLQPHIPLQFRQTLLDNRIKEIPLSQKDSQHNLSRSAQFNDSHKRMWDCAKSLGQILPKGNLLCLPEHSSEVIMNLLQKTSANSFHSNRLAAV